MTKRIYLDNAATTYPKPANVAAAVSDYITNVGCNINRGGYESAYEAEDVVFDTRSRLRELFCAPDEKNVIFTSGVNEPQHNNQGDSRGWRPRYRDLDGA